MRRLRELLFIVCGLLVLQAYAAMAQRHTLPVEAAASSASDASYLLSTQERGLFSGTWNMLAGVGSARFTLSLLQIERQVTGTFSPQNGTIQGEVTGARLSFRWTQDGGYIGSGYLDMNSDGKSMSGVFTIIEGPTKGENSVSATRAEIAPQARTNTLPSGLLKPSTDIVGARDTRSSVFYSNLIFVPIGLTAVPLDWCRDWGVNCGKPGADAYCHQKGFGAAKRFEIAENIGRTATFTEHKICNNPDCDGFNMIECVGTATVFETPWITAQFAYDARLDWCREWGVNCGKPAADAYCQKQRGFPLGARRFEIARNAGPTVTITERRICEGPTCDGFKVIECQRSP
jgi:hypothetical protein